KEREIKTSATDKHEFHEQRACSISRGKERKKDRTTPLPQISTNFKNKEHVPYPAGKSEKSDKTKPLPQISTNFKNKEHVPYPAGKSEKKIEQPLCHRLA
ncbi:MAG: hypothetical protein PHN88_15085, partial [Ignavibacteria bacterium]|nr:hypothetical protein [Ignavibacteria bacterium]